MVIHHLFMPLQSDATPYGRKNQFKSTVMLLNSEKQICLKKNLKKETSELKKNP